MRILRKEIIAETVPVNLVRSSFEDKAGNIDHWVYVERTKRQFAVFVVGVHYNLPGSQPAIILNKEYRVPIGGYVYDLPAGLAEINESPTDAAKREFLEETGYELDVTYVSPRNFSSPGITNEFSYVVYGIASGDGSKHSREDSEDITTYAITREKALQILDASNLNLGTKALMVLHQFVRTGTV